MARKSRRADINDSVKHDGDSRKAVSHLERLEFLAKYKTISDPSNERSIKNQYETLRKFPLYAFHKAPQKRLNILKSRGFFVTDKGFIADGPRDYKRKAIKGGKMTVGADGLVKTSIGQRRDFIYGFTRKERFDFSQKPGDLVERTIAQLRETNPTLKKIPRSRIQVRLQWGAYQATKDFSVLAFTKRYPFLKETRRPTKKRKEAIDRLTGLHIVVHLPRTKKSSSRRKKK